MEKLFFMIFFKKISTIDKTYSKLSLKLGIAEFQPGLVFRCDYASLYEGLSVLRLFQNQQKRSPNYKIHSYTCAYTKIL